MPAKKLIIATAITIAAIIMMIDPVRATWRPQYASAPQSVQDWYRNARLTPEAQARFKFLRCCDKSETVKTKFSVNKINGKDRWSYLLPDGTWKAIPSDIVHANEPTPEGQPVLFVLSDGRETCFFPGEGGI